MSKALALGFLAAAAAAVAAVFMRFGTLVPIVALAAWAAASWSLLALWNSARRKEFVKRFPEVVDHVVRLTRAGLPAVESISGGLGRGAGAGQGRLEADLRRSLVRPRSGVGVRGTAARVRIPEFTLFSAALCLQRTTGGGISAALGTFRPRYAPGWSWR